MNCRTVGADFERRNSSAVVAKTRTICGYPSGGKGVPSYLRCLQKLQVPPPIFSGLSLMGVTNHTMELPRPSPFDQGQSLNNDRLILSEVVFETYDDNVATTLKPVFDSIWNGAGRVESPFYEGSEWKRMTKFNPNLPPW